MFQPNAYQKYREKTRLHYSNMNYIYIDFIEAFSNRISFSDRIYYSFI